MRKKVLVVLFTTLVLALSMSFTVLASNEEGEFFSLKVEPAPSLTFEQIAEFSGIHDKELLENIYRVFSLPDDEITRLYEPYTQAFDTVRSQYNIVSVRPFSLSDERGTCTQLNRFGMAMGIVTDTPEELASRLTVDVERILSYEKTLELDAIVSNELAVSEFISEEESTINSSSIFWDSTQRRTGSGFVATGARIDLNLSVFTTRGMFGNVALYVTAHHGSLTSTTHTTSLFAIEGQFQDNMRTLYLIYDYDAWVPNWGWQMLLHHTWFYAAD
ncbi:MAG: hypothetical protein FWE27_08070 [Defluviitaleaceae bacterium]|nr:hypothetical protein [Defluviitaleaceae bacterium]